jgi:small-conductance mechanosensitive channel
VLIYVLTLLALFQAWGFGTLSWLAFSFSGQRLLSAGASVGVTILLGFVAWEAANGAIERHLARLAEEQQAARSARLRTLLPLLRTTLLVALLVVVVLMVLSDLGVNIAPLLAGAGVIGIAIGFGSQKLVQDVITGLFLLLENAVQVGDVVTLAGLGGVVEHLSIRSIRLRAEDGSVHVIPFSAVTTVTNMTRDFGYAVIEASVSYNDEYDEVVTVLRDIVKAMREEPRWASEIRDDLEVMGLEKFADSSVLIKARIRCGPFGRWSVRREFNRRMKLRFDEHGIEIPYPHQQLVMAPSVNPAGAALAATAKEPAK